MITILALGSRGDVLPFATLGQALQAAGRWVRLASLAAYEPLARRAGLQFFPLQGDAEALVQLAAQGGFFSGRSSPLTVWRALQRSYGRLAASLPEELQKLDDTELLLNQLPSYLFGADLSEHLGIPWAVVSVIPLARSSTRPLLGFSHKLSFLPGYNLATYRLGEQIGWQLFRRSVNCLRRSWGLSPQPFFGPYEKMQAQRIPVICGFSPQVVPRPPDWGGNVHLTGWWLPQEPGWQPPVELLRFLEAGPAPLFVGFGSMPIPDPPRTAAIVIEAARRVGRRLVLHSGWGGLGGGLSLPPEVQLIDYAPYGWLFPRMAALVHHGGSGTTGFALSSGVPSLVIPFAFDQFYWGERTAALGAGPPPLPFRDLSVSSLAERLDAALNDPAQRQGAARLAAALCREDGLRAASEVVLGL